MEAVIMKKNIAALLVFVMMFAVAAPAIALAAGAGGVYLGWYGGTDPDKTIKKDIENTVWAGAFGVSAGSWAAEKIAEKAAEKAAKAALQGAY